MKVGIKIDRATHTYVNVIYDDDLETLLFSNVNPVSTGNGITDITNCFPFNALTMVDDNGNKFVRFPKTYFKSWEYPDYGLVLLSDKYEGEGWEVFPAFYVGTYNDVKYYSDYIYIATYINSSDGYLNSVPYNRNNLTPKTKSDFLNNISNTNIFLKSELGLASILGVHEKNYIDMLGYIYFNKSDWRDVHFKDKYFIGYNSETNYDASNFVYWGDYKIGQTFSVFLGLCNYIHNTPSFIIDVRVNYNDNQFSIISTRINTGITLLSNRSTYTLNYAFPLTLGKNIDYQYFVNDSTTSSYIFAGLQVNNPYVFSDDMSALSSDFLTITSIDTIKPYYVSQPTGLGYARMILRPRYSEVKLVKPSVSVIDSSSVKIVNNDNRANTLLVYKNNELVNTLPFEDIYVYTSTSDGNYKFSVAYYEDGSQVIFQKSDFTSSYYLKVSFTIHLYNNNSVFNSLNKELINEYAISGSLREECSMISPEILVDFTNIPKYEYNYCYIPYFNRYYYINDIVFVRNNIYRLVCEVDPLMSFKNSILQTKAYVLRTSKTNYANKFIKDSLIPVENGYENSVLTTLISSYAKALPNSNRVSMGGRLCWWIIKYSSDDTYNSLGSDSVYDTPYLTPGNKILLFYSKSAFRSFLLKILNPDNWTSSNYTDYTQFISGVYICPIDLTPFVEPKGETAPNEIRIGNTYINVEDIDYYTFNDYLRCCFNFDCSYYLNNEDYKDYSPFSKYYLNVPLYGSVELNDSVLRYSNVVDGVRHIYLNYFLDISTGDCIIKISPNEACFRYYDLTTEKYFTPYLQSLNTNIFIEVPLSVNNNSSIALNNIVSVIDNTTSLASNIIGSWTGAVSYDRKSGSTSINPASKISAIGGTVNSGLNFVSNMYTDYLQNNVGAGGSKGSSSGATKLSILEGSLIKVSVKFTDIDEDQYIAINGLPCNKFITLSALSGHYIQATQFKLLDPNATLEEESRIYELLYDGVYL